MSNSLAAMINALGLEAAAIRKRGGGSQVELRGGERAGEAQGSWLYRFIVADDVHLRDDTPVRITAGQEDVQGILVSFRDGVLLVSLEQDLGPKVAVARLAANDAFLIERLQDRLRKVQSGEAQFNRPAAERALGQAEPTCKDEEPDAVVTADGWMNADQASAVRRSLGSNITFIWGPPGTGKTGTLARVVEAHYRAGRSVLLVSNTNIAVDTALERVSERLKGESDFHQGLVIRQGPVVKEELRRRFGPQVILEEIVARLGQRLQREKDELNREATTLKAEELSLGTELHDLKRLASAQDTLRAREKARSSTHSTIEERKREGLQHRERELALRADLVRARSQGAVRRFFSGLNPERIERNRVAAERAAQAATDAAEALSADLLKLGAELKSLRHEIEALTAATSKYPPQSQIQHRLAALESRSAQIRDRVAAIDGELAALEQEVLARCRILATTVYRTYLGKGPARHFDAVVIDEASMLMPPLVYYAGGLATKSVTVAGDFRQLPPIVMSQEPLAMEWLRCDAFEKADIPDRLQRGERVPHLVKLGTQYRMRELICAAINELFYPDRPLSSDPSVNRGGGGFPLGTAPLLFVDTAPFHPWTALRVGSFSRYNLFHALLVRNIVLHLAETQFLPPSGQMNDAVGAVSPYASQARLIQALLDDRLGDRAAGLSATVHRFQGNEKRAMILDLTDSLGAKLGRFLQATDIREDGARLLNVATSRARHHICTGLGFLDTRVSVLRSA